MIYKRFKDLELSALGMGAMRLPVLEGKDDKIDEKTSAEMTAYAMEHGVNYYDTAWGYHGGNSETVMGKILSEYDRGSYFLATKFPGYDLSNMGKTEEIFAKQQEKLRTDYFDFYLVHNVCELNIDAYLDAGYGTVESLLRLKEQGKIRHLGFSTHGSLETMKRFLDRYGQHMEFCQIQLNYIDWGFQNGAEKVDMLTKLDIPVWVMEPLRGGKLASLPEKEMRKLKELRPGETAAGWAFRFIQSVPQVTVTLSGMSTPEQMKQNIATFEENRPLNEAERKILTDMAEDMVKRIALPCTACRYCTSHCPQQLDIPMLLELYNEHCFTGGGFIAPMALQAVPEDKRPQACLGCRSCEAVCPQQIKISEAMADFSQKLG
ncbi:MAG: aldo/keto reductase [Oscillospiraceae bacterium]|nr:aldo/keto reductase [Oscillospiraceae bacterium]